MHHLSRNWWALAVRGALVLLFGLFALFNPLHTVAALTFVFGVYVLVDSVFLLVAGLRAHENGAKRWWTLVVQAILGIIVGLFALISPVQFAASLVYVVGIWAIVTGVLEIVSAIRLRHEIENEWALGISGAISVLLGIALVSAPVAGLAVLSYLIAAYALISGVSLLILAFRLRAHPRLAARL